MIVNEGGAEIVFSYVLKLMPILSEHASEIILSPVFFDFVYTTVVKPKIMSNFVPKGVLNLGF